MQLIFETSPTTSITIRCPTELVDSIDKQVKQTRQNKTNVIIDMLLSSMPSLHITQRALVTCSTRDLFRIYSRPQTSLYRQGRQSENAME